MSSLKDKFKDKLIKIVEEISVNEVLYTLENIIEEKPEYIIDNFLNRIGFDRKLRSHPIIDKIIRRGHLPHMRGHIKRSEDYKRLSKKLNEILKRQVNAEDVSEIKNLLEKLMEKAINYIVEEMAGNPEKGLRHIHAPGSVARDEGRNLYFGEKYTKETLYRLASRVCDSIALGDNLGIYSEDEDLMLELKQLVYRRFKSTFKIKPEDLGVSEDEANYPYTALLGLILWLAKRLLVEEDVEIKALIQSILYDLKTSPITLFFVPKEAERWGVISLPRLDMFIDRWVLNEESKAKIETLKNELKNFIMTARRKAKRERKTREVENTISPLMSNYEAFCRRLIEHGDLDLYAIRRMIDIVVDLSTKYDLKIYLRPLGTI
jgi:hypothetical protein